MSHEPRVILLNGGSSSGKTTVARALQDLLPSVWLRLGVDDLIEALPRALLSNDGLVLGDDGHVSVGAAFTDVQQHWQAGVAAMAAHGGRVIVEDNFVSGPVAQQRWKNALSGVETRWVGVHCSAAIAASREAARGDRTVGMAIRQADSVHHGIHYDVVVDTGESTAPALAGLIRDAFWSPSPVRRHGLEASPRQSPALDRRGSAD